ncbi:HAD family phosphatase [Zobellella taiwanensis]|uniref:HAD family phosphatase n=1 Tax=Zobellella taiwanensis TaxID=347535 RepID=A0A2P7QMR9_9GAMM|nr:HAD family phosphatase [Zobellella taiwanensis]PSJ39263.1 HAD family phosphatase [Zobellella taiwanensis]
MQYAIFDMDGLLIDSEPVWLETQYAVMRDLYGVTLSEADWRSFQGRSSREFCQGMAQLHVDQGVDADALQELLLSRMLKVITDAPLMPGAREMVDWLSEQQVPLAIASSSPLSFIEAVVERHSLPIWVLVSGTEVPRSKPHPAVFELAAGRLGADPTLCRVWEDSVNGVIAARAAGMIVTAVPDLAHPALQQFSIADQIHSNLHDSLVELQAKSRLTE